MTTKPKPDEPENDDVQDDLGIIAGEATDVDPEVVAGMLRIERLRGHERGIGDRPEIWSVY